MQTQVLALQCVERADEHPRAGWRRQWRVL